MPFTKLAKKQYPRRLWALAGEAGRGKSTFAAQMKPALLAIDADHRFDEVVGLAGGEVLSLSDQPIDHIIADRIALRLRENMPTANVGTIVVDSLTAIIKPLMVRAVRDNDAGANKNKVTAFKDKATAMSLIQDAVSAWGTDVLWIWHLQNARNEKAVEVVRATVSELERSRLQRSLNAELHVVVDSGGKRGVKVVWVRRSDARSGVTLWDESGRWQDMPSKIEAAIYDPKVTPAVKVTPPAPPVTAEPVAPAAPVEYSAAHEKVLVEALNTQPEQPKSELDTFFGPRATTDLEVKCPTTEAEFAEWLKGKHINGRETYQALGTDAKDWMKKHAGMTWADVARQVEAAQKGKQA